MIHHTDISRQNLNYNVMNRRSATDWGGGGGEGGPQNDFSLPCNILRKQMISKQKRQYCLSLIIFFGLKPNA